jgi:hypothetical protein
MFSFSELATAQIVILVVSGIWLLRRNDEVPILISGVLFYCSTYRFWAVTNGFDDWVIIWQNTFSPITDGKALEVLGYVVLGQTVLIGTYMYRQKHVIRMGNPIETPALLGWLRPRLIVLSLLGIPLAVLLRYIAAAVQQSNPNAPEVSSYLLLFPLALIGISILNISLWKIGGYPSLIFKLVGALILIGVAYLTFGPSMRFQFVGWIVGAAIIIVANYSSRKRLLVLGIVLAFAVGIFSFAGSLRTEADTLNSNPTWDRFAGASDANMLDGFVLLEEVYPDILEYSHGGEHLEVVLHPIPRILWPNKPVGGYANKLRLNDYDNGVTGISPSLFGSFYAEGGIAGIVILSVIYGLGLATIVNYSVKLRPFASLILRAVLCASLVPLLRGGDLAGIYAWVGMAYWPCFLLLWLKRGSLRVALSPSVDQERFASIRAFYAALRDKRRFRKRLLS